MQVEHTAAISSRSSLDKSGAILTSSGGGPSSPHCISSREAWIFDEKMKKAKQSWDEWSSALIYHKKKD